MRRMLTSIWCLVIRLEKCFEMVLRVVLRLYVCDDLFHDACVVVIPVPLFSIDPNASQDFIVQFQLFAELGFIPKSVTLTKVGALRLSGASFIVKEVVYVVRFKTLKFMLP